MSAYPLAVFVAEIGARSETFIRRHVQTLLPGRTVAVGRALPPGPEVDWTATAPFLDLDRIRDTASIKAFLQEHGVRVFMGEYLDESIGWLDVAHSAGSAFFGHAHGYDVSELLRDPHWRSDYARYRAAEGIITMSVCSREALVHCGLPAEKIHVVPYGVEVPAEPPARGETPVVRVAAVGRMVAKKAPLLTLEAFRRAAQAVPELRIEYVGSGPLLTPVLQFVRDSHLDAKVSLPGSRPNDVVQELLRGSDIFVQHSIVDARTGDAEGLPVAILEAMASALPVVATRHAGIPEAVLDGTSGYLVAEGDTEGMAEAIVTLARDPVRRHQMGLAGWERARDLYSWDRERRTLLKVLGIDV